MGSTGDLGEPRVALGNSREYWGVVSYPPALEPPSLKYSIKVPRRRESMVSVLGTAVMVAGRYLVFGCLGP